MAGRLSSTFPPVCADLNPPSAPLACPQRSPWRRAEGHTRHDHTSSLGSCDWLAGECALARARVELGGPPAIPGDNAPVRPEPVAERLKLLRGRRRDPPREPVTLPDSEIAGRPHVKPPELEDHEHLGGPLPDAPDRREPLDHVIIAQPSEPDWLENDRAVQHLGGQ